MSDFELPPTEKREKNNKAAQLDKAMENVTIEKDDEKKTDEPQFTPEELNAIFDQMLFTGEYSETVTIRGKLKVEFKTRTAQETEEITKKIDATPANLIATLNEKRSLLTLIKSLNFYHGTDLSKMKDEQKQSFITKLPTPIIGSLFIALQKFDEKIFAACRDAEENF